MAKYNQLKRVDEFRILSAIEAHRDKLSNMTREAATEFLADLLAVTLSPCNVSGIIKDAGMDIKFRRVYREPSDRSHRAARTLFHWADEQDGTGITPNAEVMRIHHEAMLKLAVMLGVKVSELGLDRIVVPKQG